MTLAEYQREFESYKRRNEYNAKRTAWENYLMATNTAVSTARLLSGKTALSFEEVYPSFIDEEEKLRKEAIAFAENFKAFAQSHNQKYSKEVET